MTPLKSSIGNNENISLDDVCNLLSSVTTGTDDLGQQIIKEKPHMVFCSKLSITRAEFNSSGQLGHKPEMLLVVDTESYNKEKKLEYQEQKFNIYKTFARKDGHIELFCEVNSDD
jgi:SPP1 family predicted phage head-tail adaptor